METSILRKVSNIADARDASTRLCQILANLNYAGQDAQVDSNSFTSPNFRLVSEILTWLGRLVEGDQFIDSLSQIPSDPPIWSLLSNRTDRLRFLSQLSSIFRLRLGIKLDLLSLYRADISSCAELLKVAILVEEAVLSILHLYPDLTSGSLAGYEILDIISSTCQKKTSQIPNGRLDQSSAEGKLSESTHPVKFQASNQSISIEGNKLESKIKLQDSLKQLQVDTRDLEIANEALRHDLSVLADKLHRKDLELRSLEARSSDTELENQLYKQSPEMIEKFEQLQQDFDQIYSDYVSKYRNLSYLKACIGFNHNELGLDGKLGGSAIESIGEGQSGSVSNDQTGASSFEPDSSRPVTAIIARSSSKASTSTHVLEPQNMRRFAATPMLSESNSSEEPKGVSRTFREGPRLAGGSELSGLELDSLLNEFVADAEAYENSNRGLIKDSDEEDDGDLDNELSEEDDAN